MEDFIGRLKRQDEEALNFMIDTYMPFLKGICQHILAKSCGQQAAEECLNDVFLTIWQKACQFEGDVADFRKWAGMLAKYKAIDRYRRLTKQQNRETMSDEIRNDGHNHDTEDEVLQNESREEMLVRLHELPEADRELFLMKYYLDLSNRDIADALCVTISAVENRLYRGKRKLVHLFERKERFI
ncbi:sigma-70 family RNA polymerase sigma factor [Planomicrobium sp. CPCC 101079]|uniref:sigma-70 family RNA polymerase sigma factor n=1 Tax=Planomicrobium sp. CPCC 101079 TaxID=2599618 RepID=UPI0011B5A074|nr:sigma-70 family RNA polymerase sigma factor [Planomicrobium sp. CPCC 101079]TWT01493.1 sigma-70 family RNA polymerase sigma factor [Planomicrobium sp. CPCC 101079]